MACALAMLFSMGQVNNAHSTIVKMVYAWAFPTRHAGYLACVCWGPTLPSHSEKQ
jgi:hypothetical protein